MDPPILHHTRYHHPQTQTGNPVMDPPEHPPFASFHDPDPENNKQQHQHTGYDAPPISPHHDALDLDEVKRLASKLNLELVYFSKESKLISFEPSLGHGLYRDETTNDDDRYRNNGRGIDIDTDHPANDENTNHFNTKNNDRVRINVHWTTGNVGIQVHHPSMGGT
eukprot:CAMPEP_0183714466 /NCGR_PEP_ID=MMETSP0737-20130205/8970_1 /TAXON_ID=385413 /ORGANISM="Thalassiosira miniscula, Strain CCMP1093" /LENGTH=165 /DNA_ID=CAMNT_0025943397 /DNA_START=248 /DNA_END=741 /DNA_ORIENTATION=-